MSGVMNIGDVAKRTGLPAKTIRYYEEIELLHPARHANGYRYFSEADVHKLRFLAGPDLWVLPLRNAVRY